MDAAAVKPVQPNGTTVRMKNKQLDMLAISACQWRSLVCPPHVVIEMSSSCAFQPPQQ